MLNNSMIAYLGKAFQKSNPSDNPAAAHEAQDTTAWGGVRSEINCSLYRHFFAF
jgi:hypothetical protein